MSRRYVTLSFFGLGVLAFALAASPAPAGFAEGRAAYSSRDYATAYDEFSKEADAGHAEAQFWLGVMYDRGRGVPRDYAKAARWYGKAAEQDHAMAQHNLGWLYRRGRGVPRNLVEAYKWFSLFLAKKPDSQHAWALGNLEEYMTQMEIAEGKERANNWRPGSGN